MSNYEDMEYISDFLPEEGEAVVVTRRGGELYCQPFRQEGFRDGITDAELYGRLVQANARLRRLTALPIAAGLVACFALCVLFHVTTGAGWASWYVDLGFALLATLACVAWISVRRHRFFHRDFRPVLEAQLRRRGIYKFSFMAALWQHGELQGVSRELADWTD